MRVTVDVDLCQGHAVCQAEAPTVFTVPRRGHVDILEPNPGESLREDVENAVRYCPTRALSLIDGPDSTNDSTSAKGSD